jgi:hypothetical protein
MRGISRGSALLVTGAVIAATGLGPLGVTASQAITPTVVRYAAPDGGGVACTKAEPCSIVTAVNNAPGGSEVLVTKGSYGSASQPLTTTLAPTADTVIIQGSATSPPTIYEAGGSGGASADGIDLNNSALLQAVTVVYSGPAIAVSAGSDAFVVDDSVTATADASTACRALLAVIDSLCLDTGANGDAVSVFLPSTGGTTDSKDPVLEADTIVATGHGGTAINLLAGGGNTINARLLGDIAEGQTTDLAIFSLEASSDVTVTTAHSDIGHTMTATGGGSVSVTRGASDTLKAPKFVDAAAGNFQEQPTSPTVNHGFLQAVVSEPGPGINVDFDLVGHTRRIGSRIDMGAYELRQKPTAGKPTVIAVGSKTASLGLSVDAEGSPTTFRLVAVGGGRTITSAPIKAGKTNTAAAVEGTIHGLAPHLHYLVHAVAKNVAGHVSSPTRRFTTQR